VPNYGQGTATFDVIAIPPPQEGSGGGSGGGDVAPPGGELPAVGLGVAKELPVAVLVESHSYNMTTKTPCHDATGAVSGKGFNAKLERDDANGMWKQTYKGGGSFYHENDGSHGANPFWDLMIFTWSDTNPDGSSVTIHSFGAPTLGNSIDWIWKTAPQTMRNHVMTAGPGYLTHYCAKGVKYESHDCGDPLLGDWRTVTLSAKTKETLYTGGKARVSRRNLIGLTAGAEVYGEGPASWPHLWAWTDETPSTSPAYNKIEISGLPLNSNYQTWMILPDNSIEDVTVNVIGAEHYDAGAGASKYKSYFTAYCKQPNPGGACWEVASLDDLAGHSWWKLDCDLPIAKFIELGLPNSFYLDNPAGFFPRYEYNPFNIFLPVPGELKLPGNGDRIDASSPARIREIGFDKLLEGLGYTDAHYQNPPAYQLQTVNCTTKTIEVGKLVGVSFRYRITPQCFGIDLNNLPQ